MTQVWFNRANGHQFEYGADGTPLLNGKPCAEKPDWVSGDPDYTFGPIVAWSGGECPVDEAAEVRALFRSRRPYIGPAIWPEMPEQGRAAMWQHAPYPGRTNPAADIVAYQVRIA